MNVLAGLLHPLTVLAHLLALIALGLLIGGQRARLTAAAFALGLTGGLVAIALGTGETPALDILLAMTALAGILVALAQPLPAAGTAGIAVIAGVALGLDSPPEAISIATATFMLIGTGVCACVALILIATVAGRLTREWQRIGMRIVGSWMAATAILVLALRFARGMMFG
jgi:hydrogenase/urease accessory protein HupE